MPPWAEILLVYLSVISLIAVILTITDKVRAVKHKWRVPEATLLTVAALGGSVTMLLTMLLIRHKTRHPKFMLGIPIIIALQGLAALAVFYLFK